MVPKHCTLAILLTAVAVCLLSTGAWGQEEFTFGVSYFSNNHVSGAPDETTYIVNPGTQLAVGDLCANIYVFDANEEPSSCCSCRVSANGELALSTFNLTRNSLIGFIPPAGDIKIVSAFPNPVTHLCDPTQTSGEIEFGLTAWQTHVQKNGSGWAITEAGYAKSHGEFVSFNTTTPEAAVEGAELSDLQEDCQFILMEGGSGNGNCEQGAKNHAGSLLGTPGCTP